MFFPDSDFDDEELNDHINEENLISPDKVEIEIINQAEMDSKKKKNNMIKNIKKANGFH